MNDFGRSLVFAALAASLAAPALHAADPAVDAKDRTAVVIRAVGYLRSRQNADGSFAPRLAGPGVSAVVAAALIRNGVPSDDPLLAKTLAHLESKVQPDGGVYEQRMANYTTSVALVAFAGANTGGKYDAVIRNATRFLRTLQAGDDGKVEAGDVRFGGLGYDGKGRPDLSNTQYFLDALQAAGVGKDDPAVKRALVFVNRCQNLPGEHNDQPFAAKTSDDDRGGLVYNPIDPDKNDRDRTPQGGLRSAGAMTYGGLKSFLYAGVSKDDPRVQGALKWIRAHYTLDENPGMGKAGLFYYYHTFGKAMTALGEDKFTDAKGVAHDWRRELFEALKTRQRPDGSWINKGDRTFGESNPELATAFALLALSYCK
jgi:Squalene-hopene cyclase C-terminal domain/Prenyltransferase and squalene oxidase repeat